MPRLLLLCVLLTEYPYSLTPGGIKADYYASHDFPAWVDMKFAGEIYWVHTTIHRGEGLTDDGRRARCGNHFRTELPPGAEKLPSAFKFLVPILDNPLPGLNEGPPAVNLTPPFVAPPLLSKTPDHPASPILVGAFPVLPVLIPGCDENKNNCKKKKKPPTGPVPEPSTWVMMAIGCAAIAIKLRNARSKARKRSSSIVV